MSDLAWSDVSQRIFYYTQHDTRDLRNKYLRMTHTPFGVVGKLPKDFIINALVRSELGDDIVDEYQAMAKVWRDNEQQAVKQWLALVREPSIEDEE